MEYFWLICGLWVGLGGAIAGKLQSKKHINKGQLTKEEINKQLFGWVLFVFGTCIVFQLLQLTLQDRTLVDFNKWSSPQKEIAVTIAIVEWISLLLWVLFFGGEKTMAKNLMIMTNLPDAFLKPIGIKIIITILMLVSFAGLILAK